MLDNCNQEEIIDTLYPLRGTQIGRNQIDPSQIAGESNGGLMPESFQLSEYNGSCALTAIDI